MDQQNLFESIKQNLNGRPGQPIVLGVCKTLAERFGQEPWVFRAAVIVLGVFFTFATLAGYILLGLLMPETAERSKGVFRGLALSMREWIDRLAEFGREILNGPTQKNGNSG
jgi:phage shock protein PspC (stress-responsive transcriptional regulator)